MGQKPSESEGDDIPEIELSEGVCGEYCEVYQRGTNVVLLDPEVAWCFAIPLSSIKHSHNICPNIERPNTLPERG